MDYREFVEVIRELDFINDDDAADAGIKAVLGILTGSVEEDVARKITDALPDPLDLPTLRGQARVDPLTFDQCVTEIARQLRMTEDDARELVNAVLRSTRAALGGERLAEVEDILPETWRVAIEDA